MITITVTHDNVYIVKRNEVVIGRATALHDLVIKAWQPYTNLNWFEHFDSFRREVYVALEAITPTQRVAVFGMMGSFMFPTEDKEDLQYD